MPTLRQFAKTLIAAAMTASLTSCGCIVGCKPPGAYDFTDDAAISSKIREFFIADPTVKAADIHVEIAQGDVELSGNVDTKAQEERAVSLAGQVCGVKLVKDEIALRPQP